MSSKSEPEANGGQEEHDEEVVSTFFIASGDSPVLLEAVDEAFDDVASSVDRPVERSTALLGASSWNGVGDAASSQVRPVRLAGVALVADDAIWSEARPASWTSNGALLHKSREHRRVMSLSRRQVEGNRLALSFAAEVDFRGVASSTTTQGFRRWVPPFAPAACWCARTDVLSTK